MDALNLIEYIANKEIEEKMFLRWVVGYQDQMSFDEFKEEITPALKKTDEDIQRETLELFSY